MPKEFSEWLGAMVNSIEDASIIDNYVGDSLTPLQVRMSIANLLVPIIMDEDDVADWLAAFSVDLDSKSIGRRSVTELSLRGLIGESNVRAYVETDGSQETVVWLKNLKKDIKYNKLNKHI